MTRKKKIPLEELRPELIVWEDHWEENDKPWYQEGDIEHEMVPVLVHQVGWIVKEDRKGLLMIYQWGDNKAMSAQTFIMKSAIKSRTQL